MRIALTTLSAAPGEEVTCSNCCLRIKLEDGQGVSAGVMRQPPSWALIMGWDVLCLLLLVTYHTGQPGIRIMYCVCLDVMLRSLCCVLLCSIHLYRTLQLYIAIVLQLCKLYRENCKLEIACCVLDRAHLPGRRGVNLLY